MVQMPLGPPGPPNAGIKQLFPSHASTLLPSQARASQTSFQCISSMAAGSGTPPVPSRLNAHRLGSPSPEDTQTALGSQLSGASLSKPVSVLTSHPTSFIRWPNQEEKHEDRSHRSCLTTRPSTTTVASEFSPPPPQHTAPRHSRTKLKPRRQEQRMAGEQPSVARWFRCLLLTRGRHAGHDRAPWP